jgi:hypothetical protein
MDQNQPVAPMGFSRQDAGRRRRMRFYSDIRNGVPDRDKTGKEFELLTEAVVHAHNLAAELRGAAKAYWGYV